MNPSTTPLARRLLAATGAAAIAAASLLTAVSPASATPPTSGHIPPGLAKKAAADGTVPVLVELNVTTTSTYVTKGSEQAAIVHARKDLVASLGHRPAALKTSKTMPMVAFHATPEDLEALDTAQTVESVIEDQEVELAGTTWNGSPAGQQLPQQWDFKQIRANTATNNGYKGAGQLVAVIDTGVQANNPYLSGRVAYEACFSTTTPGSGSNAGQCPNGTNVSYGAGASRPCAYSYSCSHGTHVAHTAAGAYGVASGAKIIAINAAHRGVDAKGNPAPLFYYSDMTWALNYVYGLKVNHGVKVAAVNMSIGGGNYTGYCDGVAHDGTTAPGLLGQWFDSLRSVGIAPVVSSGNDGQAAAVGAPACFRSAISVGNTTLTPNGVDAVYAGSNSNSTLDLLAPGTDICSAVPTNLDNDGTANGWQCGWIGTSMAAPQVAGAIAVLRGYWPGSSINQVERALKESGRGVYDSRNGITRSRIDVWAGVNRLYQISKGA
ncbi:MAG: S8 family serine peptidase [Actinomycetes bacterium]